jgi:hypothetical protein
MKTKLAIILGLSAASSFAGTSVSQTTDIQITDPSSAWWLTIAPYGWVTATDGDMGVAGRLSRRWTSR